MKGRSEEQVEEYEEHLGALASILASSPMTVAEIIDTLDGTPAGCGRVSVYLRIRALEERGYDVKRKKRRRVAGKSGSCEREFWIEVVQ